MAHDPGLHPRREGEVSAPAHGAGRPHRSDNAFKTGIIRSLSIHIYLALIVSHLLLINSSISLTISVPQLFIY